MSRFDAAPAAPQAAGVGETHPCYDEHQPGCDCVIPAQTVGPVPSYLERLSAPSREPEGGAVRQVIIGFDVEEYVDGYEFRGDEGSYTPTENERALITDAIHGYDLGEPSEAELLVDDLKVLAAPVREEGGADWRTEYNRVEAIREAAEGQDRIARGTTDPIAKSDAETQAAGYWKRYEREVAKLNALATREEAPASDGEREPLCMAYKTGYADGVEDSNGMFDRESCEEGWGQYAEKLSAQPALPARLPLPTVDDGCGGRRPINPQDDR